MDNFLLFLAALSIGLLGLTGFGLFCWLLARIASAVVESARG